MSDEPSTTDVDLGADDSAEPVEPAVTTEPDGADERSETGGAGGLSDTAALWISAIVGLVVAAGSVWLVQGPLHQTILRVRPTVEGGGLGSGWVTGNAEPVLNALVTLVHLADVILGAFIIVLVVVHWASFRRLADRMQSPASQTTDADTQVATDGGSSESQSTAGRDGRSPGGEPE